MKKTIIYDGFKFTKSEGKTYYRSTKNKTDLHRYVWVKYNGEIQNGFHVHHKDHNTDNNSIENLEILSREEHLKYHASKIDKKKMREWAETIRPLTKEWHGSEAGIEWHKKHYENNKDKLHVKVEKKCQQCGDNYFTTKNDSKFCSNKCKAKFRRDSGVDNVEKKCEECGGKFVSNKYAKIRFCGKSCSKKNYFKCLKDSPNLQENKL